MISLMVAIWIISLVGCGIGAIRGSFQTRLIDDLNDQIYFWQAEVDCLREHQRRREIEYLDQFIDLERKQCYDKGKTKKNDAARLYLAALERRVINK